jgi:hypothetical protein
LFFLSIGDHIQDFLDFFSKSTHPLFRSPELPLSKGGTGLVGVFALYDGGTMAVPPQRRGWISLLDLTAACPPLLFLLSAFLSLLLFNYYISNLLLFSGKKQ